MARHESEALWAFASNELEDPERLRVADHVAGCEACAQELSKVREAQAQLRAVQDVVPGVRWDETDDRIQSAAARRIARMERKPRWTWAFATVGVVAVAVLAWVVLRPAAPQPQPPPPVATREVVPPTVVPTPQEPPVTAPAPAPVPPPAPVIATQVESASGAWIREADAPERALQAGGQLHTGAAVRTHAKSSALLRLPDASRVRLSPDSEVTLARTEAQDVHLTVTKGRLAVQASHVARQGFTVEAAGVSASVVGTVFSVERMERGAVVAVLEGKVRVDTAGQPPRFVSAGERLKVYAGQEAPKAQALSAQDRRAFQELKQPPAAPHSPAHPSPAVNPAHPAAPPQTAPAAPTAPPNPTPEKDPAPVATKVLPRAEDPSSEFAPYPAPSQEPEQALATAPSTPAPETPPGATDTSPPGASESGRSLPATVVAAFLSNAREQLSAATCESFLVGLADIAETSRVREFREQALYLRARCFEEKMAKTKAEAEYRRYLREFPQGRFVRAARAALLP